MQTYLEGVQKQLPQHRKNVLENTRISRLLNELELQLASVSKELEQCLKPAYVQLKSNRPVHLREPNSFDLAASYKLLENLTILDKRADDILAEME